MKLFRMPDAFISSMLGNLTDTGKAWARFGLIVLIVAALMSYDFGNAVSWKHGVFLALLSVVAAFGPEVAHKAWQERNHVVSVILALICAPLLAIEFYSHAGYTAGLRGHNIAETKVANVKYDDAQKASHDDELNLDMWRKQLQALQAQNAWATTIKADGLRAQLAVADKEIELETARGGCKAKCATRMKEKADLEQRIAMVEKVEDLSKRIESTQRILDRKRETAATVKHESSPVALQNAFLAEAVTLVGYGGLEPSPMVEKAAQQSANLAMALAGTGLPALCFFISGLYRRHDEDDRAVPTTDAAPAKPTGSTVAMKVAQPPAPPLPTSTATGSTHTREIITPVVIGRGLDPVALKTAITDERIRQLMNRLEAKALA